jgi:hypothetical protein
VAPLKARPNEPPPGSSDIVCASYKRALEDWKSDIERWNRDVASAAEEAARGITDSLANLRSTTLPEADRAATVCRAVHNASNVIASTQATVGWDRSYLIIFSDMADEFPPDRDNPAPVLESIRSCTGLRFDGTRLVVAQFYCAPEWPQQLCSQGQELEREWVRVLREAGACTPERFLRREATTPAAIQRALEVCSGG